MKKGFTLMELIIYIALIAMVGTAIIRLTISVSNSRNKNVALQEVQAHGRTAMQLMSQKIKEATSVQVVSSTFGTDPGVLTLLMDDSAKNPTIIDLTADNGRVRITEGTSDPYIITDDSLVVTNLTFTDLTSTAVRENIRIQMTISFTNPSNDVNFDASAQFQSSVSLRQ